MDSLKHTKRMFFRLIPVSIWGINIKKDGVFFTRQGILSRTNRVAFIPLSQISGVSVSKQGMRWLQFFLGLAILISALITAGFSYPGEEVFVDNLTEYYLIILLASFFQLVVSLVLFYFSNVRYVELVVASSGIQLVFPILASPEHQDELLEFLAEIMARLEKFHRKVKTPV